MPAKDRFVESFTRAFVTINLSQYPESLIESELFGHRKGAFTGAIETHEGSFERCSPHGAIFLDEIGEVSIPIQIKLLARLTGTTLYARGESREQAIRRARNRRDQPLSRRPAGGGHIPPRFLLSPLFGCDRSSRRCGCAWRSGPQEMDELLEHLVERIVGEKSDELVAAARSAIAAGVGKRLRVAGQCARGRASGAAHPHDGRVTIPAPAPRQRDWTDRLFSHRSRREQWTRTNSCPCYCALLYRRHGTYEEVARRTKLDRRTVKKYVLEGTNLG